MITLFYFLFALANATSTVTPEDERRVDSFSLKKPCTTTAQYLGYKIKNEKVFWNFEVLKPESQNCPKEDQEISVLIWEAQYSKLINKPAYPEYVTEPEKNKKYLIKIYFEPFTDSFSKKKYSYWRFVSLREGPHLEP